MLIGVDCRLWSQTGVGRYTRNLVLNLLQIDKKNNYILFAKPEDKIDIKIQISKLKIKNSKFKIIIADIKFHSLAEQTKFPPLLNSYTLDLMHFPYFSVPIFYRKNYIVTVHDLIKNKFVTGKSSTLPFPVYITKQLAYKLVLKNALKKSKKIIVPSLAVKNDILKTYKKINPQKIEVTYEGGLEERLRVQNLKFKVPIKEKYFLRVGNYFPHKNVKTLLTAFKLFIGNSKNKNIKLVLIGKKDFFFKEMEKNVNKLKISENIIFMENKTDNGLISLYSNSIATIVPSYIEGFSLTAVEAMSLGSPLILSDIDVHREICGNLAFYFNPKNFYEFYEMLIKANNLTLLERDILSKKEKEKALQYSWKKMALQTLAVYENSASTNSA
ncbi:MAG: hypothetical protein COU25_03965 [Candidatus Levybacteria bacterium CG10_big_fil_rev_8_21_14_0_10_35_13]|nr:MAG: hypothetical protein COU25_03965 [Candidatus Levybacteria bacterium CG10_big_fil_rev_8_21_14_0_10_35_13]